MIREKGLEKVELVEQNAAILIARQMANRMKIRGAKLEGLTES